MDGARPHGYEGRNSEKDINTYVSPPSMTTRTEDWDQLDRILRGRMEFSKVGIRGRMDTGFGQMT